MSEDAKNVPSPDGTDSSRQRYQAIVDGEKRSGSRGRILFCVSTDQVSENKGDLFVALGLAAALSDDGWGVSLWPSSRFTETTPDDVDIAVLMLESHVPGLIHRDTRVVAWVRNWTSSWAELPYLDMFSQIWCSSTDSARAISAVYDGRVEVVPLATDADLFTPLPGEKVAGVVTTANFWGVERSVRPALEKVSTDVPVTWFGTNSRFMELADGIDHRDAVDYFALPEIYARWTVVVDDLIPPAARYGNHNSRLFDALACGAVVVTNTPSGLAELGLAEVPTYDSGADLTETVQALLGNPEAATALAQRLRAVVLAHHTWPRRAVDLSDALQALLGSSAPGRSALLRWAAAQAEEARSLRNQRDMLSVWYNDQLDATAHLTAELGTATADAESAQQLVHGIRTSRSYRVADRLSRVWSIVRRRDAVPMSSTSRVSGAVSRATSLFRRR